VFGEMSSPSDIEAILQDGGRYDPAILPLLEEHLKEQLRKGTYNLDANLAMMKLYLLFPEETKVECMAGILLKAVMAFPATDFALCMYQIPEKYHQAPELKEVIHLAQQLEMAKFKSFWKECEGVEALSQASGWQNAVRSFIAGVVASTYRSIKSDQFAEYVNLPQGPELEAVIKARGWTRSKEDKDVIVVNTASFESVRVEPKAPSNLSLEQYRSLVMAASSA
jgi:translation initiation factor 3 subunit K